MYNNIMASINEKIIELCEEYSIQALYFFGSRAAEIISMQTKEALPKGGGDVDVALLTEGHFSISQKVDFSIALEKLLGVERVDLVVLNEADPFLAANAIRGYRFYARDDYIADEFELYVLRRAGDLTHLERQRMGLILGEINHDTWQNL